MESRILNIVKALDKLHINDDYAFDKNWKDIVNILSEDEDKTIEYLLSCSDTHVIWHLSAIFHDLAGVLQSKKYINCLEKLEVKYPELKLKRDVELAKDYTIDWDDAKV